MLSGFQRYFCMQYTTCLSMLNSRLSCVVRISKILLYAIHNKYMPWGADNKLCCQDFKDTFVCNTQLSNKGKQRLYVVLSGFQRYFCMQYTTVWGGWRARYRLCYQDFKDTFVCNTQRVGREPKPKRVVLSGFQRYLCIHNASEDWLQSGTYHVL